MPRPTLVIFGARRSAFHVCGFAGLAAALATCAVMLDARGVTLWALPMLGSVGVATFMTLALATKVVTGRESLTYYHHEIAILLACWAAASLAGLPVLASLDAAVLGIGAFLAFGRVGCLMVGCCHGRPSGRGVRYGREHAEHGFPESLVDVPLVPVQPIEAAVAAAVTVAGLVAVAMGSRPGVPLLVYVVVYGLARFALEEWRGDAGRHYLVGFSEAQWTSLLLTSLVGFTSPLYAWAGAAAAVVIGLAMAALVLLRTGPRRAERPA